MFEQCFCVFLCFFVLHPSFLDTQGGKKLRLSISSMFVGPTSTLFYNFLFYHIARFSRLE